MKRMMRTNREDLQCGLYGGWCGAVAKRSGRNSIECMIKTSFHALAHYIVAIECTHTAHICILLFNECMTFGQEACVCKCDLIYLYLYTKFFDFNWYVPAYAPLSLHFFFVFKPKKKHTTKLS